MKWEAAFTWISGILLLAIIYYLGASEYLIDPAVAALPPWLAIAISVVSLIVGWVVYDLLWRSPLAQKPALASAISFVLAVAAAYAFSKLFSGRAAYIQTGALLGTIMAANVWMIIIPAQRKMVAATKAGTRPDPADAHRAKHRSLHNNYMTLPVVFIMFSGHYSSTFGHELNWLILAGICLVGGLVRHVFNLRNKGRSNPWLPPAIVLGMIALALVAGHVRVGANVPSAAGEKSGVRRGARDHRAALCHLSFGAPDRRKLHRGAARHGARHTGTDPPQHAEDQRSHRHHPDHAARQQDGNDGRGARDARPLDRPGRADRLTHDDDRAHVR